MNGQMTRSQAVREEKSVPEDADLKSKKTGSDGQGKASMPSKTHPSRCLSV
jgi:hypothetical protein